MKRSLYSHQYVEVVHEEDVEEVVVVVKVLEMVLLVLLELDDVVLKVEVVLDVEEEEDVVL